jgi:hypothetical protein
VVIIGDRLQGTGYSQPGTRNTGACWRPSLGLHYRKDRVIRRSDDPVI